MITKEKGTLIMLEKLCSRLRESRTDGVAQKCAYCLTLLTHTEKSIRRLMEHMKDFKGKFQIPEVHGSFNTVIAKASKAGNNHMKVVMEELTAKVDECLKLNEGGEEVQPPIQTATQGKKKGGANGGRGKKAARRSYSDESGEEGYTRPTRGRARRAKNTSESD